MKHTRFYHVLALLAAFILLGSILTSQAADGFKFQGMAMIRLDSGQTWYSAVDVRVDRPFAGEWFWSIMATPETEFWARDIDLMIRSFENDHVRDAEISCDETGIITFSIPRWGKVRITPSTLEARQQLLGLTIPPGPVKRAIRVFDYPRNERDQFLICIAHERWAAIW